MRLDARTSAGPSSGSDGKGAMRPFLGMRTAGPARDWRAGVAWHRGQHLEFGFEASRRDSPTRNPPTTASSSAWSGARPTARPSAPSRPHRTTPRQPRTNPRRRPRKVDDRHCGAEMRARARQGRQNAFPPRAPRRRESHRSLPGSLRASRRKGTPSLGGGILPSHAPARARRTRARQFGKGPPLKPTLAGNAPVGAREGKMPSPPGEPAPSRRPAAPGGVPPRAHRPARRPDARWRAPGKAECLPSEGPRRRESHRSPPGSLRASRRKGTPSLGGGGHLALPRARKGAQDPCTPAREKGLQPLKPTLAGNAPAGAREGKMPSPPGEPAPSRRPAAPVGSLQGPIALRGDRMRAGVRQGRQNAFPPRALDGEGPTGRHQGVFAQAVEKGRPPWGGGHLALPRARKGAQDPCMPARKRASIEAHPCRKRACRREGGQDALPPRRTPGTFATACRARGVLWREGLPSGTDPRREGILPSLARGSARPRRGSAGRDAVQRPSGMATGLSRGAVRLAVGWLMVAAAAGAVAELRFEVGSRPVVYDIDGIPEGGEDSPRYCEERGRSCPRRPAVDLTLVGDVGDPVEVSGPMEIVLALKGGARFAERVSVADPAASAAAGQRGADGGAGGGPFRAGGRHGGDVQPGRRPAGGRGPAVRSAAPAARGVLAAVGRVRFWWRSRCGGSMRRPASPWRWTRAPRR